ncbi:MAG: NlpC/P60 family protein [Defluviitaleaceae bacterium]|nr:NlpC/P60 family protein [Defluviitaleaceae bacterium]
METWRSKLLAVFAVLLMAIPIFALGPFRTEAQRQPTTATGTVADRIEQLRLRFPAETAYFTVSGLACNHPAGVHSCSNCRLSRVMTERLNYSGLHGIFDSYTCVAFARYAIWWIFGGAEEGIVHNVGAYSGNIPARMHQVNSWDEARPGDLLIWNRLGNAGNTGHMAIYLGNRRVFESNVTGQSRVSYGYNRANWGEPSLILRANNWDAINNSELSYPTPTPQRISFRVTDHRLYESPTVVQPFPGSTTVVLERHSGTNWTYVQTATNNANGWVNFTVDTTANATYRIRQTIVPVGWRLPSGHWQFTTNASGAVVSTPSSHGGNPAFINNPPGNPGWHVGTLPLPHPTPPPPTPTPTPTPPPTASSIFGSFIVPNPTRDIISIELREESATGDLVYTINIPILLEQVGYPLNFTFTDIAPGTYSLIFQMPGFTRFILNNVVVEEDEDIDLNQDPRFDPQLPLHPGDISGSNQVNIADLSIMLQNWMGDYVNANLTGSGQINISDLNLLLQNWMATSVIVD